MRDVPPRSAEHNCDASADHATDVTAEKSDEGASSAAFVLGFLLLVRVRAALGAREHERLRGRFGRVLPLGVGGRRLFPPPPHHDVRFGGGGGADASSSESEASPGSSSGLGKRHTTTSPFDVPAARFTDVPEDATASDVTAPFFTSSVRFPSNAPATRPTTSTVVPPPTPRDAPATARGARPSSPGSPPRPRRRLRPRLRLRARQRLLASQFLRHAPFLLLGLVVGSVRVRLRVRRIRVRRIRAPLAAAGSRRRSALAHPRRRRRLTEGLRVMKHQSRGRRRCISVSTCCNARRSVACGSRSRRLVGGGRGPVIVRRGTRVVLPETNPAGEEIAPAAVAAVLFRRSRRGFLTAPAPERSTAETPPSSTLSPGGFASLPAGFNPAPAPLLLLRARSEPSPEHRRLFLLRVFRRVSLASTRARFPSAASGSQKVNAPVADPSSRASAAVATALDTNPAAAAWFASISRTTASPPPRSPRARDHPVLGDTWPIVAARRGVPTRRVRA